MVWEVDEEKKNAQVSSIEFTVQVLSKPNCPRSHGLVVKMVVCGARGLEFNPSSLQMLYPPLVKGTREKTKTMLFKNYSVSAHSNINLKINQLPRAIQGSDKHCLGKNL